MKIALITAISAILSVPVLAQKKADPLEELAARIKALEARITVLEARHTFTSFMPNFAERFHVMHRAGEAGDWAVASHELNELKRLSALAPALDAEKGKLMETMMGPDFEMLEHAIEHGNSGDFNKALVRTIDTCNACHAAVGSEFIQVNLDASEALSLRHPHRFSAREMPEGHHHDMPSKMGGMMESESGVEKLHDHTNAPNHMN